MSGAGHLYRGVVFSPEHNMTAAENAAETAAQLRVSAQDLFRHASVFVGVGRIHAAINAAEAWLCAYAVEPKPDDLTSAVDALALLENVAGNTIGVPDVYWMMMHGRYWEAVQRLGRWQREAGE